MLLIFVVSLVIMACIVVAKAGKKGKPKEWNPNCALPPDDGPCRARIPSYYFDNQTCREFMYGGCEGNDETNFSRPYEALSIKTCKGKRKRRERKEIKKQNTKK
uniref:Putative salivary kunitz domain protein n=1 Tax=Ixodes ricinus TaxID=34613 RepID=A0A0K8R4Y0_IXORI